MADLNDIQLRIIVQGTGLDNLNRINDQLAKATGNIANVSSSLGQNNSLWQKFGDSLSELERRFDAVFRAASHLQALGRDLTGMGEAGLGMLRESVDAWGEYEFGVHRAAGALGIFDTTAPIFHRLQQAIDETAQEARLFPAEEIAKAVYFWGSATGQTVKSNKDLAIVMDGLLPIMQTAAITETDYETAIKGTYQIIQQYKLGLTRLATEQDVASGAAKRVGEEMSNTRDITEKLMMITQNTAVEYSDLIESFRYTGSIAPSLGVKYEELAVVLGRLGDLGIRGSTAGRALQQTFTKLLDPTVRASKALDEAWQNAYGLDKTFADMVFPNGEFIGLTEYIDMLADVTEDMTMKERGNLVAIMTTQNELRTMIPLIEDQIAARKSGISVYDQEKYALENASAQFESTMHLLEISWKGTMGYLRETIMPVVRLIGSEVARLATPFIEAFGVIVKSVKAWLDTHPEIVKWIVQIVAVASVVAIMAGAIFTALGVILAFGAGIGFVIGAVARFAGVFTRFFPIVGAIITVITALVTNFGGLRDAAMRVVDGILAVWNAMNKKSAGAGLGVLERLGQVIMPMLLTAAEAVAWILERVADILEWIARTPGAVKVVEGMAQALGLFMVAGLVSRISGIAFSILTLGGNALGASTHVKMLTEAMSKFFSISTLRHPIRNFQELNAMISMVATDGKKKIISMTTATVSAFSSMASGVGVAARFIATNIRGILIASGIGILIAAIALLAEAWINNWGDIQGKTRDVLRFLGDRFDDFVKFIGQTWDKIVDFVKSIGLIPGQIADYLNDLHHTIRNALLNVLDTIATWATNVFNAIVGAIVEGFERLERFLSEFPLRIGEYVGDILGAIVGVFLLILVATDRWLEDLVTKLASFFAYLPGRVNRWLGETGDAIRMWFGEVLNSFVQWATGVLDTVGTWFGYMPGRVMRWLVEVRKGIADWWNELTSSIGSWASGVIDTVGTWFGYMPGRVMRWFNQTMDSVRMWFVGFGASAGEWSLAVIEDIGTWFGYLPGRVMRSIEPLPGQFAQFLKTVPAAIWEDVYAIGESIVQGIWQGILDLDDYLKQQISNFMNNFIDTVLSIMGIASPSTVFVAIGNNIVQGLWKGISDLGSWLFSNADQYFGDFVQHIRDFLGIHSPALLLIPIGIFIIHGITEGMRESTGELLGVTNDILGQVVTDAEYQAKAAAGGWNTAWSAAIPTYTEALNNFNDVFMEETDLMKERSHVQGELIGDRLQTALKSKNPDVVAAARQYKAALEDRLANLNTQAAIWGGNIGSSFASSIALKEGVVRTAAGTLATAVYNQIGIRSPAKEGPLRWLMEFGPNLVKSFAGTINSNAHRAEQAAENLAQRVAGPLQDAGIFSNDKVGFAFDVDRHITIDHKVSSPDGTVNSASQSQLREIFTAEEFVSALEHMATVG